MSEDARNSLIALGCVSLLFGSCYLFMWLMPDDLVLPSWIGLVSLPVLLFVQMLQALRRRRKKRRNSA